MAYHKDSREEFVFVTETRLHINDFQRLKRIWDVGLRVDAIVLLNKQVGCGLSEAKKFAEEHFS